MMIVDDEENENDIHVNRLPLKMRTARSIWMIYHTVTFVQVRWLSFPRIRSFESFYSPIFSFLHSAIYDKMS